MLPGMGIDPAKMAAMQEVSKHITALIRVDYKERTVNVCLSTTNEEASTIIPSLLSQFANSLAQQFSTMFAMKGEIVEVNKQEEPT